MSRIIETFRNKVSHLKEQQAKSNLNRDLMKLHRQAETQTKEEYAKRMKTNPNMTEEERLKSINF